MLYLLVVAAIGVFWLVGLDRPALKVTFKQGLITQSKGVFPPAFKQHILGFTENHAFDGQMKVYHKPSGVKVVFSQQVPKKVQQHIRHGLPQQGFKTSKKASK